jgi:uncharacterized protein (DUF2062 family)
MTPGGIIGALVIVALVGLLGAAAWEYSVVRWERRRDREGGVR